MESWAQQLQCARSFGQGAAGLQQEKLRARRLTGKQIVRLEEAWKAKPDAKVEDLDAPGEDKEAEPVALRYEVCRYHNLSAVALLCSAEPVALRYEVCRCHNPWKSRMFSC